MIREIIASVFLFSGIGFVLLAALGALRFPDPLTRMAAVSKASTLGVSFIFMAVITMSLSVSVTIKALLTIAFLALSAPIAAHLIARATLISGEKISPKTRGKEIIDDIKKQ